MARNMLQPGAFKKTNGFSSARVFWQKNKQNILQLQHEDTPYNETTKRLRVSWIQNANPKLLILLWEEKTSLSNTYHTSVASGSW